MKQLITLVAISIFALTTSSANPLFHEKKPAKHKANDERHKNFQVTPNNKTGNATVSFTGKAGKATIVVLNEDGNTVITQPVKLVQGKNKIDIPDFTNLTQGYYTICLNTTYKSWSAPFLLWK